MFIYVAGAPVSRNMCFPVGLAFSRQAVVAHVHLCGSSSCVSESMLFLWFTNILSLPGWGLSLPTCTHVAGAPVSRKPCSAYVCYKRLGSPLEPHMWPPSLPPIALQSAPSLHPSCPQFAPSLPLACPLPPSPNVPDANLAQCVAQGMTELACRIFCSGVPTFPCPIFSCPNYVFPVV
jgi:hypothetical protein